VRQVGIAQPGDLRSDQHVHRRQLPVVQHALRQVPAAAQDRPGAGGRCAVRLRIVARQVDADHDVGTAVLERLGRQVRQHAAIDQEAGAVANGTGEAGQAHAGLQGRDQLAEIVHDRLAADEVGRRGDERDRQILEALRRDVAPDDRLQAAAAEQPREPPVFAER
jgi:hypothetical protein